MPRADRAPLQPRKTPIQRRSHVTVDAILEATLQVLRKEGLARFTTTRVAEVAGVSVGTLYQYFPHKRALVAEIVRRHMARIEATLLEALAAGGPLQAQVRALVAAFVALKRDHMATSLALRAPKQEADGARIIRQGMRRLQAALHERWAPLVPAASRDGLATRIAMLVAAVDGVAQFAIEEQPALLEAPAFELVLLEMSAAALGLRGRVVSGDATSASRRGTGPRGARRAPRLPTGS